MIPHMFDPAGARLLADGFPLFHSFTRAFSQLLGAFLLVVPTLFVSGQAEAALILLVTSPF